MSAKLSAGELRLLHQVLRDAGYLVSQPSESAETNVAAMLLIKLFTDGVTDPAELSRQLEYRFGKHPKSERGLGEFVPSDAIRGLTSPEHAGRRSPNWGIRKPSSPTVR
jgi:hypothetical protein